MLNKRHAVLGKAPDCPHPIVQDADSWGGYVRWWCEQCRDAVIPAVPWSEVISDQELHKMCDLEGVLSV